MQLCLQGYKWPALCKLHGATATETPDRVTLA